MRNRFIAFATGFSLLFGMSCFNCDVDLTAIAATENDDVTTTTTTSAPKPTTTEAPKVTTTSKTTEAPKPTTTTHTTTTHTHNWVAVNKTVHHDEVGHWETKNKPYTVTITYSGKVVNSKENGRPTLYDGLKALGCWNSSYVNYHSDKSMTGANFTSFDFGTRSDIMSDDTFSAIKDYYDCGSTTSCNKRTIMETTYNSWDELSNDLAFYKSEFGLDLSYAKENCYEKTWVVDKAAYDETVVVGHKCTSCGATDYVMGDINGDEEFTVADVVLLQKWLLAVPDVHMVDWEMANFCRDDRLDVFDLCLMKRALLEK